MKIRKSLSNSAVLWIVVLNTRVFAIVTPHQLSTAINYELTNSLPKIDAHLSAQQAGIISADSVCQNAADATVLKTQLVLDFTDNAVLKTNSLAILTTIAGNVAADVFTPGAAIPAATPPPITPPSVDVSKLANAISKAVKPWIPGSLNPTDIEVEAGIVAASCKTANTSGTLYDQLMTALAPDIVFNIGNNKAILAKITSEIVLSTFPITSTKAAGVLPDTLSPDSAGLFSLWTGSKLLNPYTIDTSTRQLGARGSTADAYIEVDLNSSFVTRSGKYALVDTPDVFDKFYLVRFWEKLPMPDISGSFGYIFANGNSMSNVTASTVVGNSDIYGAGAVGLPLFRECSSDYRWKQQAALEISGGFATDKSFDVVHPSVFLGGGYQLKCPNFIGSTNSLLWFGRAGVARIDRPQFSGNNVVINNVGGLLVPQFDQKWVPAMGTTIVLPITSSLSIQAGGDAYFSSAPANWDITLGVTLDLTKFAGSLGSLLGISP
jgi:hypothetical protein